MTSGVRASKTRRVRTWLIVLFGVLVAPLAHVGEALTIDITPRVCLEGANVRVTVRVDPDPDNRILLIEADSVGFFLSSEIQLNGERAPLLHTLFLRSLPSGSYVVRATVTHTDGITRSAPMKLRVLGADSGLGATRRLSRGQDGARAWRDLAGRGYQWRSW
jgi:hypothetical protein